MKLEKLRRAIDVVEKNAEFLSARQVTYLRTYPALLELAKSSSVSSATRFLQVSAAAYGWMPRIVRIEPDSFVRATNALEEASQATGRNVQQSIVDALADCLYSVVGASKVLHFVNPRVYPIWDSKVEGVWTGKEASYQRMSRPQSYVAYAKEVHDTCAVPEFSDFFDRFNEAYQRRLDEYKIMRYEISHVRSVEAAAFELSSGEYEDV